MSLFKDMFRDVRYGPHDVLVAYTTGRSEFTCGVIIHFKIMPTRGDFVPLWMVCFLFPSFFFLLPVEPHPS